MERRRQIHEEEAGLPAPSIFRTWKIACIDAKDAEFIGRVVTKNHREFIAYSIERRFRLLRDFESFNRDYYESR